MIKFMPQVQTPNAHALCSKILYISNPELIRPKQPSIDPTESSCIESNNENDALIVDFPAIPRRRSIKQVKFCPTTTLHQWENDEQEMVERRNSWYNKKDYKRFRNDTKYEVAVTRRRSSEGGASLSLDSLSLDDALYSDDESEEEMCVTGIEHLLCPRNLSTMMKLQSLHKQAIIEEQWRQVTRDQWCPQSLRAVSKRHSKYSKARAWKYAGGEVIKQKMTSVPPAA